MWRIRNRLARLEKKLPRVRRLTAEEMTEEELCALIAQGTGKTAADVAAMSSEALACFVGLGKPKRRPR